MNKKNIIILIGLTTIAGIAAGCIIKKQLGKSPKKEKKREEHKPDSDPPPTEEQLEELMNMYNTRRAPSQNP